MGNNANAIKGTVEKKDVWFGGVMDGVLERVGEGGVGQSPPDPPTQ